MGQKPSSPKPGTRLQVIGSGLSRTGTSSFSLALAQLLDGPVYHGGTQITQGPEEHVKTWLKIFRNTPIRSPESSKIVHQEIARITDGYAAITDTPGAQFTPELLDIYPDAIVICTVRDVDRWAESMDKTADQSLQWYLRFALALLPSMRFFTTYIDVLREGRYGELYFHDNETRPRGKVTWDKHIAWLKKVVPEEKLVFYDVKDGWVPLCKALNVEVPDVEFPRINDGRAIETFAKEQVIRGFKVWAVVIGTGAVAATYGYRMWRG